MGLGMDGDAIQFYEAGKNEGNCGRDSNALLCLYQSLLNFCHVSVLPVSVVVVLFLACFCTDSACLWLSWVAPQVKD